MNQLAYVRTVLWSFFRIRRGAVSREEFTSVKPLVLVASAICLTAAFGLVLWSLAHVAVATLK